MSELFVLVPGRIESRTGGYAYDRRIVGGLRSRGWDVAVHELDSSFPRPTWRASADAAATLAAVPSGALVLIDGLAFGAMPDQVEREASRLRIVALVHLPLADEPGLDRQTAAARGEGERRALAAASLVVVTGASTVSRIADMGVPRDLIAVVEPGTDPAPIARGSIGAPLHLLSVAALTPGKGHEILIRALAAIPHRDWLLTCAGSLDRDPATVERVRAILRDHGLEPAVSLAGELDAHSLEACYNSADIFVLATLHETFCMAVAEALARGLPVVSTRTGAIPGLVCETDEQARAGLLAEPGDLPSMTSALASVIGDAQLRARLAAGARRVREGLPTWDHTVDAMIDALSRVSVTNHVL
jgi:glycosyltransferase involved in cell wall biosynthesis